MLSVKDALTLVALSPDETRALKKLEAVVDATLHGNFDGSPARIEFKQFIPMKLAYALRRKYEEQGGWEVHVAAKPDLCLFTFVPKFASPPTTQTAHALAGGLAPLATVKELPPVVSAAVTRTLPSDGRRLLVRMPTRGRPAQALTVLERYRTMAGMSFKLEVIIDEDDETMMAADVLQRLNALDCVITVGQHKSKVEACNGGRVTDWDVLLLASDDMVPVADGWAVTVMESMEKAWPHLDGAIFFDDGFQGPNLCTLPVMGRRWYDRWGCVYQHAYKSLFCDVEQTLSWREMGRLVYVEKKIIEHRHHLWSLSQNDETYKKNDALESRDKEVFEMRQASKFCIPPMWLSICIATLPSRRAQLNRLVDHLCQQKHPSCFEVVIDNREGVTIGEKRQALLERAKGRFVSFVDDDDWVSHDYAEKVVEAVAMRTYAPNLTDCASLKGVMTTAGTSPEVFEHSIKYTNHDEWRSEDGKHFRSPNHLNPVRRELALQAGFRSMSHGEDYDYLKRLQPLLKNEVEIDSVLYYYWFQPKVEAVRS